MDADVTGQTYDAHHATLGRTATLLHLFLVLAVAAAGVGVLLMIGGVMLGDDAYSRDLAVLALLLSAPLWLLGLVAVIPLVHVLRGRPVSRRRAIVWAVVALVGGALLAASGGQVDLAATLLTRPDGVGLQWPAIFLVTADGSGTRFLYADQPGFWLPIAAIVLGAASLIAAVLDRYQRHRPDRDELAGEAAQA